MDSPSSSSVPAAGAVLSSRVSVDGGGGGDMVKVVLAPQMLSAKGALVEPFVSAPNGVVPFRMPARSSSTKASFP